MSAQLFAALRPTADAASRAARALRHEVKRAEYFTASGATPQQTCLAGVRWADVVILLVGSRYGDRQDSGLSATHEEYREARDRCPCLSLCSKMSILIRISKYSCVKSRTGPTGHFTANFSNPEELRDDVTAALLRDPQNFLVRSVR